MTRQLSSSKAISRASASSSSVAAGHALPWFAEAAPGRVCALLRGRVSRPRTTKTGASPTSRRSRERRSGSPRTTGRADRRSRIWRRSHRQALAARLVFVNGRFAPRAVRLRARCPQACTVSGLARRDCRESRTRSSRTSAATSISERDAFCGAEHRASSKTARTCTSPAARSLEAADPSAVRLDRRRRAADDASAQPDRGGDESQATVIEDYVSLGDGTRTSPTPSPNWSPAKTPSLAHYMIEREHTQALQRLHAPHRSRARSANVASHSLCWAARWCATTCTRCSHGEGGECLINGLFIGSGDQHLDNHTMIEHASPHCGSHEFYKGILDGSAHGVFNGKIIVRQDAQKTDAKQTNRNLLLSDDAQIDTKPQLEIFADDVKCTHGATIGQLDEDALFYLRSRGIDEVSARKLLLFAFASECLDRMKQGPVRKHVEGLINRCLFQMANSAPGASTENRREDTGRNWEEIG